MNELTYAPITRKRVNSIRLKTALHNIGDENEGDVAFEVEAYLVWLQAFKQFFINVSYHILVASLTLMALF